jgi:adenosylcobinamide kinase/adenosylcobinamide-phosphate guanylyltransferase
MKAKLLFISGGSWSGKTGRATQMASSREDVVWLGTALPTSPSTSERIATLKAQRPQTWATVDTPFDLTNSFLSARKQHPQSLIIIDSVSQWIGNEIAKRSSKHDEEQLANILLRDTDELCHHIHQDPGPIIMVSSDFGTSPPPQDAALRILRMVTGRANQAIADVSNQVELMMAGVVFSTTMKTFRS